MTVSATLGKFRHLQHCSTPRGGLAVLALDHRGNLRQLLRPDNPSEVTYQEMVDFKRMLVRSLSPAASAVLLDPQFSAAQCIAGGDLPGQTGLVVAVEASGYSGDTTARGSRVLPGWSVEKTKRMGASAVKLLVYYHPESPTSHEIEELVQEIHEDCRVWELPLFLETLSYSLDPVRKKLPPDERHYVVVETARRLTPLGGDILKIEFPLDIAAESDESGWRQACHELSQASQIPWVLLSGSADYETFLRQVTVACQAGASGVAVGRAIWRETTELPADKRQAFLDNTAFNRMRRITALVDALARPWMDYYSPPDVKPDWFEN
jgi:tagatose-1,6-bisphosphate aldolase